MTRYDKLKQEISAMSLDEFIKNFVSDKGMKEYICGDIDFKTAECYMQAEHDCVHCIRKHLESEVTK